MDIKEPGKAINFILLLILISSSLTSLVWEVINIVQYSTSLISIYEYIGIALTAVCTFLFIKGKQDTYKILLGLLLILGNFGVLPIFHYTIINTFNVNIGSIPIYLYWGDAIYTVMLIAFIIANRIAVRNALRWAYRRLPGE